MRERAGGRVEWNRMHKRKQETELFINCCDDDADANHRSSGTKEQFSLELEYSNVKEVE